MQERTPRIFIDADACPVTAEALVLARNKKIPVCIVGNYTQNLDRHVRKSDPREPQNGFWVETVHSGSTRDAADFVIIERLNKNDIVITQDIGLAAMVLGKNAYAIGVRGREYDPILIDTQMEMRHIEQKIRRQGGRTGGPSPITGEDKELFQDTLARVIEKALSATNQ